MKTSDWLILFSDWSGECQFYLSLKCSMCHFHDKLGDNSSLSILSPLYPGIDQSEHWTILTNHMAVLQPNNICDYDIELDPGQDVAMTIEDLSLPGYQYSSGHNSKMIHCLHQSINVFQIIALTRLCWWK